MGNLLNMSVNAFHCLHRNKKILKSQSQIRHQTAKSSGWPGITVGRPLRAVHAARSPTANAHSYVIVFPEPSMIVTSIGAQQNARRAWIWTSAGVWILHLFSAIYYFLVFFIFRFLAFGWWENQTSVTFVITKNCLTKNYLMKKPALDPWAVSQIWLDRFKWIVSNEMPTRPQIWFIIELFSVTSSVHDSLCFPILFSDRWQTAWSRCEVVHSNHLTREVLKGY